MKLKAERDYPRENMFNLYINDKCIRHLTIGDLLKINKFISAVMFEDATHPTFDTISTKERHND